MTKPIITDEMVDQSLDIFMDADDWRTANDADVLRTEMRRALEAVAGRIVEGEREACANIAHEHAKIYLASATAAQYLKTKLDRALMHGAASAIADEIRSRKDTP